MSGAYLTHRCSGNVRWESSNRCEGDFPRIFLRDNSSYCNPFKASDFLCLYWFLEISFKDQKLPTKKPVVFLEDVTAYQAPNNLNEEIDSFGVRPSGRNENPTFQPNFGGGGILCSIHSLGLANKNNMGLTNDPSIQKNAGWATLFKDRSHVTIYVDSDINMYIYIYVNYIHIRSYMCLVDTFSKYVHMIYVCIYILYTLIGKLILQKILETTHPPLPSAINPCVFVSVESKVPRPTCHPNQLPAIHRFSFPHRWSTLPLHQGPGEKNRVAF